MNVVKLDNNRIILIQDDCLNAMRYIKPNSIDLIFADLPYGTTACKWDQVIPFEQLWKLWLHIKRPNTPIILTAREPFTSVMVNSNIQEYHHKWVWNKKQSGSFHLAKLMPLQIEEDVIVFGNRPNYYPQMRTGKPRYKGGQQPMDRELSVANRADGTPLSYNDQYYPVNIIDLANLRNSNNIHPTQKPVELLDYIIMNYTRKFDTVLDPTFGSCTTGASCVKLYRKFIGIEKDEYYFNVGVSRIKNELRIRDEQNTAPVPANSN